MKTIRVNHSSIVAARRVRLTQTVLFTTSAALLAMQVALVLQAAGRS
jgi:hypothetical protein